MPVNFDGSSNRVTNASYIQTPDTQGANSAANTDNAKLNNASENDLQEVALSENEETGNTASSIEEQTNKTISQYDNQIQQYYKQIMTLREQLKDIDLQKRSLASQMGDGADISQIQASMQQLNSEKDKIYSNINTILITIMSLEDSINNVQLQAQAAIAQANSFTSNSASYTNTASSTSSATATTFTGTRTTTNARATKLADTVINTINRYGSTTGWCLRGVNRALNEAYGISFAYPSAYMALEALQARSDFTDITNQYPNKNDLKNLPAGAIVVWDRNSAHPHGHISIALGDGREASDHIANQYTNSGGAYHIFMPNG